MSNKRAVARQLKAKKKQQKQLAVIICAAVVVVVVGIFAAYGYGVHIRSYIMVYEGEQIDVADFRYSMLASEGSDGDVKANAEKLLVEFLTIEKHARDENIVLTEEEKTEMLNAVGQMKSLYGQLGMDFSFISETRMAEMMSQNTYYTKLMENHTTDYVVDEADFATRLADYKENQQEAYYNVGLKYITAADSAAMDEAAAKLTADNFDEIAKEYSDTYTEENGPAVTELKSAYLSLPEGAADEILALEVGGRTEPIEMASGSYVLFEVTSRSVPTDEEVETAYREQYALEKKNDIFRGILDGWIADAQYEINRSAYEAA